eukprot:4869990-Ditylum_brightwellii.AAC.1
MESMIIFQNDIECDWIPTISSAPAHVVTTDGMVTWENFVCLRIVEDIKLQQDGTFQMYLNFLDEWESSLLQYVDVKYPLH